MASLQRQKDVLEILQNFRGLKALKSLASELNYDVTNAKLPRREWQGVSPEDFAAEPSIIATAGDGAAFSVIYTQLSSDNLRRGVERPVINALLEDHPYALFVFSNKAQDRWHFTNVKYSKDAHKRRLFRRIAVAKDERLRTASERLAMLDVEELNRNLYGLSPLEIQTKHDEAFNVETVTKQFFNEYKAIYDVLQKDLTAQTNDKRWAHDYALQFLNRVMFIYFIQRKRWLGDDTEFLRAYWESYRGKGKGKDSFFESWLQVLFFEAFNQPFTKRAASFNSARVKYLPEDMLKILRHAPYLNGGLFNENDLDRASHRFNITDTRFEQTFEFLERYNFTISEDSPLDQEVAVDPEMIGKVYESLVNVSTEADERGDAGIFYTPRIEIDLMCRLALVDHLTNHFGAHHKTLLYELVFALEPQEKQLADRRVKEANLWTQVDERLREITVLDPACGSGSFLVGMLYVLDDLQCRADAQTNNRELAFDRRKRIIGQSLYGVDVMDWAAHVAELRMWLALITDAQFTRAELSERHEPLLPHFSFKIRSGDSLVQEIGGLPLSNLRDLKARVSPALKGRITTLKREKLNYYRNDGTCKFKTPRELEHEELSLFRDLLDDRAVNLEANIKKLQKQIDQPQAVQVDLLSGAVETQARQMSWQDAGWQREIARAREDVESARAARSMLKTAKQVPFVWDIAFVEVFGDERKKGFDIVVGNPPYVRQEAIADPRQAREKVTTESKRAYKAKLQKAVYQTFPHFFRYDAKRDKAHKTLDAKSDLYIYFYFLTLPLLNDKGSFIFITSNSWLDVGYGADLQEFLLRRTRVRAVIDNAAKRSFESADVNTVITLLSSPVKDAPDTRDDAMLAQTARFVMFKTGFENALSPRLFENIETADARTQTAEYRVFPITQKLLLEDGMEAMDDADEATPSKETKGKQTRAPLVKVARYIGNKWGGKYLRAPEIYWTILERGKDKLVRLSDVAEVRFGIKTGANEFFYIDKEKTGEWQIETKFLQPVIKSPRECRRIAIRPENLKSLRVYSPQLAAKVRTPDVGG